MKELEGVKTYMDQIRKILQDLEPKEGFCNLGEQKSNYYPQ